MYELDLHGVKHADVYSEVDRFIYKQQQRQAKEVTIQTGNSERMKQLVNECLADYGMKGKESMLNNGVLIVTL